ncbi:MAG: hypothetical protein ABSG04_09040, partial [Verrucomicrobiota bacterium]
CLSVRDLRLDSASSDLPEKAGSQGNVGQRNESRRVADDSPDFSPALSVFIRAFRGSRLSGCGFPRCVLCDLCG